MKDCGEAGHADGCCGTAQCLPSANRFNKTRERAEFEDACYAHYLKRRVERQAGGQGVALDDPNRERPREELFARTEGGDYIAIVYQAAWGGWKLARGG